MATRDRNEPPGRGSGLFVQTSDEDLIRWNRQRIVNALLRETDLPRAVAVEISREIQETIGGIGLHQISTTLIRELVDIKLIERGFQQQHARHTRIGLPMFDTENLITRGGPATSPGLLGPEATNRALAESIKRDFALLSLFSDRVAVAHRRGDIHLEHLGQVDRPHSCLVSPEYIKKFGLSLPGTLANARPARQPEVLLAHLARFSAFLQGHFSNSIAWDLLNVYLAPFLRGLSAGEVNQLAQFLVYEFSQLSAARDNRPIFCDLHICWGIPRALRKVPALGPAGEETGKTYGDYRAEAKAFARALVEVMAAGDGDGSPFFYPTPVIRLDGSFTREPGSGSFLRQAAELAVRQGTPLFIFDRGSGMQVTDLGPWEPGGSGTWTRRCHSLQAITVNLPRLAYRAAGSDDNLQACLEEMLELCATAHLEKRIFLEKLLAYGKGAPLSLLLLRRDGAPLLDLDRTSHLIGLSGLNEMVQIHIGSEMHRGKKAHGFAVKMLRHIAGYCREMSARHRVVFHPAESFSRLAPSRFARKDLRYHSPQSGHVVKGELSAGEVHYTRSVRISGQAGIDLNRRLALESEFHPFLAGGALFEVPLGGDAPAAADAVRFIRRAYSDTLCSQLAFSPRFNYCADCHRATGTDQDCPGCGAMLHERIERRGVYYAKPEAGDLADQKPGRRRQRYGPEAFRNRK